MKAIEAELSISEDRVAEAPTPPMRVRRAAATPLPTAEETSTDRPLAPADKGHAPSGWWLVPAVIGGLLVWVWLIRLAVGWIASLI